MVATRDTLFVAGPPVVVNEAAAYNNVLAANVRAQLASQDEALRGAKGSLLQAVSRENGRTLSELKLDLLPVFDGMAAARGKLFVATTAGTLVCYRGE